MRKIKIFLIASTFICFSSFAQKSNKLPESLVNFDINYSYNHLNARFPFLQWKAVVGSNNSGIVVGIQREQISKITDFGVMGIDPYYDKNITDNILGYGKTYFHRLSDRNIQDALSALNAPSFVPDDEISWSIHRVNSKITGDPVVDRGWTFRLGYQYGLPLGFYVNSGIDLTTNRTKDLIQVSYEYYEPITGMTYSDEYEFIDKGWGLGVRLWTGLGYALSLGKDKKYYLNAEATYTSLQLTSTVENRFVINAGFGFRIGAQPKTTIEGASESNTVKIQR